MKQIALDKLYLTPKLLMTALVILTLSVFSMIASAAGTDAIDAGGKTLTERFNHMATGFPLTGMHATAECGSCHVGGLFKGTARNCSGCHSKGQRVVATAMSSKHLVTTEPCEVCHNNTVTFYGARYNHGKAIAGQCTSCHNGFIASGKASTHTTGSKATKSCDNCHRTYAWSPASWNHFGSSSSCVTCHVVGGEGAAFVKTAIGGTTPEAFSHNSQNSAIGCESCHRSYSSWSGAAYNHAGAGTACATCHNSSRATGTAQKSGHVSIAGSAQCSDCHTSTSTWLGALGAMPSNHIPSSLWVGSPQCSTCHVGSTVKTGSALHAYLSSSCNSCHYKGGAVYLGNIKQSSHKGNTNCGNSGCHSSFTTWNR